MAGRIAFQPGILRQPFGSPIPFPQALLNCQRRIDGFTADFFNPKTFHKIVSSFQEISVLTVILEEQSGSLQRLLCSFHGDEQVRLANLLAGSSTDDYLPASFLADETDVFDGCLCAIARA